MSAKKKSKTLAEKIGEAVSSETKIYASDDEDEETRAKVVDYDSESEDDLEDFKNQYRKSNLRVQNARLLEESDKRYSAKKVSASKAFDQYESSEEDEDDDGSEDVEDADDSDKAVTDEESEASAEVDGSDEEEGDKEEDDDDDDDDDNEDSEQDNEEYGSFEESNNNSSNEEEDDEESDYDELDESKDLSNPLRRDRESKNTITTVSNTNIDAEIEKGEAVRSQLRAWENLLEMRIKLQKCLIDSNKMPQYDTYKNYNSNSEFKNDCKSVTNKLNGLLSNLLDLQSKLLNQYPETKGILSDSKKSKTGKVESNEEDPMDEEIPSDFDEEENDEENESESRNGDDSEAEEGSEESDEESKGPPKKKMKLDAFEKVIAKNHKIYKDYRNSVIQKWNDKVRISTGAISKGPNQPVLQQIDFILANKDKLRKKTQLKRSEYEIIGKSSSTLDDNDGRRLQEYDEEIYDDDDFYHQLLKELIEFKSADIQDPLKLSQQWVQLQNMRSKLKRKIDTRATKGRRLRYDVHQKLVNFMAPITVNDTWTDHAKDELYSSLFGKIKPVSR